MSQTEKIPIKNINVNKRIEDVSKWDFISEKDKKDITNGWIKELRLGTLTGKVVADGGVSVYLSDVRIALEFMKKPIAKIGDEDIRGFHEAMAKDTLTYPCQKRFTDALGNIIVKTIQKPYSLQKKKSIKRSFRLFLKWRFDEKAYKWDKILKIKLQGKEKDIYAPTEQEVEKMFFGCKENFERFLVGVLLFDCGLRAEEAHNVRVSDVIEPKTGENFYKIRVRSEFSKTKGRVISCYWKHSPKAIKDYLEERLKEGAQPEEPIFNKKYSNMRKFLARLGEKTIGKKMHYHALRHSSASFFIYRIKNDAMMNYRYGWGFGSPMIQRYSRRRDMSEELDKEVEHTEIGTLKSEIEKLKLNSDMKDKELEKKNKEFSNALESHNREMMQIKELLKVLKKSNKGS